jgi:hypothetical protein
VAVIVRRRPLPTGTQWDVLRWDAAATPPKGAKKQVGLTGWWIRLGSIGTESLYGVPDLVLGVV